MHKIHKYALPITDSFELELPMGAEILYINTQGGEPFLWCSFHVEQEERTQKRKFTMIGTGQEFSAKGLRYIGSLVMNPFVWHWYEIIFEGGSLL